MTSTARFARRLLGCATVLVLAGVLLGAARDVAGAAPNEGCVSATVDKRGDGGPPVPPTCPPPTTASTTAPPTTSTTVAPPTTSTVAPTTTASTGSSTTDPTVTVATPGPSTTVAPSSTTASTTARPSPSSTATVPADECVVNGVIVTGALCDPGPSATSLAFTGSSTPTLLLYVALLLGAGTAFVVVARRIRRAS